MKKFFSYERHFPYLLGFVCVAAACVVIWNFGVSSRMDSLLGQGATISSIMVGFLATMISVLMTIPKNRTVKLFMATEKWVLFCQYIRRAIVWSIAVCGFSVILVLVDFSANSWTAVICAAVWSFLMGLALGSTAVVLELFYEVVKRGPES